MQSQPVEEHFHRPMEETQAVLNENSYISAVSHYKQSKPASVQVSLTLHTSIHPTYRIMLQKRKYSTSAEYAEPYEVCS